MQTHSDTAAMGWRPHRWAWDALPLATSLSLHVAVVALGVALYHAVERTAEPNRQQVVVPETAMVGHAPAMENVRPLGTPSFDPTPSRQDSIKTPDDTGFDAGPSAGPTGGFVGPTAGSNRGRFPGTGVGTGTAPWGLPHDGGGGGGLGNRLFEPGPGIAPNDVVYLCDASGSMVGVFGALKQELKRSISEMAVDENAAQRFNVIFFNDDRAHALFPDGPRLATAANKALAGEFIDNQYSAGGTQPLPAIRMALAERPDLLYVLTDGFDQIADMSVVTDAFRKGDADGRVHINCIFLQSDEDPKLVAALKQIADVGHGNMRVILKKDM